MLDMINGYNDGIQQIVKQMKKEKIDIKTISKITGLPEDEINKID